MKASGNGMPQQCVQNLIRTIRGEVPYDRLKGIDLKLIDQPSELAGPKLTADIEWLIGTYEPRTNLNDVELDALVAETGSFAIDVDIKNL